MNRRRIQTPVLPRGSFIEIAEEPVLHAYCQGFLVAWSRSPFDDLEVRRASIPCWSVVLACAVAPGLCLRALVRCPRSRTRQRERRCLLCGYDLRASPERWPECGRAAAALFRGMRNTLTSPVKKYGRDVESCPACRQYALRGTADHVYDVAVRPRRAGDDERS